MKPIALLPILAMACAASHAQVYRCTQGGKTTYSQTPCTQGDVREVDTRPNTIDTSMDWQRNQRYIQRRQMQQQVDQMRQIQSQSAYQAPSRQHASTACTMAIRNANTQSMSATPDKIDNDRAKAAQVCGYNPWPGPSMAELDAQNKRSRAIEESARRQQSASMDSKPKDTNPIMANCDPSGCWGTNGTRYNRAPDNTFFSSKGGACTVVSSNQLSCP